MCLQEPSSSGAMPKGASPDRSAELAVQRQNFEVNAGRAADWWITASAHSTESLAEALLPTELETGSALGLQQPRFLLFSEPKSAAVFRAAFIQYCLEEWNRNPEVASMYGVVFGTDYGVCAGVRVLELAGIRGTGTQLPSKAGTRVYPDRVLVSPGYRQPTTEL